MASVSGVSSSSSIYGNRNIFSGLASGLDTESMIENSISGYKEKINSLIQQQTKLTWKQDAYRGITDKMIDLTRKYTSYTSKTNLASNAFFNNAVKTTGSGVNADKISATGRTTSKVTINSVSQLASAAAYKVDGSKLMSPVGTAEAAVNGGAIDWNGTVDTSNMSGSLELTYGTRKISLSFGTMDVYKNKEELLEGIRDKLSKEYMSLNGETVTADKRIDVKLDGDKIVFSDGANAGNSVYISNVSGDIEDTLGIKTGKDDGKSFTVPANAEALYTKNSMTDYMSNKKITVSFNGTSKLISMGDLKTVASGLDLSKPEDQKKVTEKAVANLNEELKKAFGDGAVTAKVNPITDADGKEISYGLSFDVGSTYENSTLSVTSDYNENLGFGSGLTNYLNTKSTLGELLGDTELSKLTTVKSSNWKGEDADPKWSYLVEKNGKSYDKAGNRVDPSTGELLDDEGEKMYALEINGTVVGNFSKNSTLDEVMNAINNNSDAGVAVSHSKLSNSIIFASTSTGSGSAVAIKDGGLAAKLFGATANDDGSYKGDVEGYSKGTDAILSINVNGENLDIVRASNDVEIDGLTVTLKGTFNQGITADMINNDPNKVSVDGAVELTSKADADTIVDAIKSFVEDINAIMKETHDAYATQPNRKSNNRDNYEPLTEDEKEGMSDSEIEKYEEKAKQGILFGDSTLSSLYSRLRSAITPGGDVGAVLRHIGITTEYSNGITTLAIDEDKLRTALDNDPDQVRDVFAQTVEGGAKSNGLIANLKKTLDTYSSTSIASPGILVRRAGTTKSALSLNDNTIQDQINNLDKQIDRWQDKMSDKIDYYTKQFTALEQLMSQMNSQSSMLSGMMGGY